MGEMMTGSETKLFAGSRAPLAIRPSLHSIEDIVNHLSPFYGPHCPIVAVFGQFTSMSTQIEATLSTIAARLPVSDGYEKPVLIVG